MKEEDYILHLDADKIYNRAFDGSRPGYNCNQVDTLLDTVIKDYETFERYRKDAKKTIGDLEMQIKIKNQKLLEITAQRDGLQKKVDATDNAVSGGTNGESNLKLVIKCSDLEKKINEQALEIKRLQEELKKAA